MNYFKRKPVGNIWLIYSSALDLSIFDKIKRQISSRRRNSPKKKN